MSDGTVLIDKGSTSGFDDFGNSCNTFDESLGNADCPIRLELTWSPICKSGLCLGHDDLSRIKIDLKYKYNNGSPNAINIDQYSQSFYVEMTPPVPPFFITVFRTTTADESITIPCSATGMDVNVDWGDDSAQTPVKDCVSHSYPVPGDYTVKISGTLERIDGTWSRGKLIRVEDLGAVGWKNLYKAFWNCPNLEYFNAGSADLSQVTSMINMFSLVLNPSTSINMTTGEVAYFPGNNAVAGAPLTIEAGAWNTSSVTRMDFMFAGPRIINFDFSQLNTSNVTSFQGMFYRAKMPSLDLSALDTTNITDLSNMFRFASMNSINLSGWSLPKMTTISRTFSRMQNYDNNPHSDTFFADYTYNESAWGGHPHRLLSI